EPYGKIAYIDHLLYFAEPFLERLSHFIRHQRSQRLLVSTQRMADLTYHLSPAGCWPGTPFQERLGSCRKCTVKRGVVGTLDGAGNLTVYRRDGRQHRTL